MKYCSTCRQTYENRNFCGNDGTPLTDMPQNSQPVQQQQPMPEPPSLKSQYVAQMLGDELNPPPPPEQTVEVQPKKRSWFGNLIGGLTSKPPQVSLEIDRPGNFYERGETVKARATVSSQDAVAVNEVYAGLFSVEQCQEVEYDSEDGTSTVWKDYPQLIEKKVLIEAGELPAGFQKTFDLQFQVPTNIRATYTGHIIKLNSHIKIEVDRPAAKDASDAKSVIIPSRPEQNIEPVKDYIRISPPDSKVQMLLWIPKMDFEETGSISGKVLIDPLTDAKVRSISLNLNRSELTTGGDRNNKKEWTDQTLQLAGETQLQTGTRLEFDFQMPLLIKITPTFTGSKSSSKAFLEVNLDVPWGKDFTASQEIQIFSAETIS